MIAVRSSGSRYSWTTTFNEILRLVRRSQSVKAVLAENPHLPSFGTLYEYLSRHPKQKARLYKAAAAGRLRHTPSRIHFRAIEKLVSQGMAITAALDTDSRFPTSGCFHNFLAANPDFRQRLEAAKPIGPRSFGHNNARFHFDEILKLVASGISVRKALESDDAFPSLSNFNTLAYGSVEHRDRLAAAMQDGKGIWRGFHCTDEDYNRALAAIVSNPGTPVEELLGGDLPTYNSLRRRRQTDGDFRARYDAAVRDRDLRPNAKRRAPATTLDSHHLYRLVAGMVSRKYEDYGRDDIISNIVVDVLAGKLSPDKIAEKAPSYARQWQRENSPFAFRSLDEQMFDDGTATLIDTLSANEWTFEAA